MISMILPRDSVGRSSSVSALDLLSTSAVSNFSSVSPGMEIKLAINENTIEIKTCVKAVRREVHWLGISDDVLPGVELNNTINCITRTISD